MTGADTTGVAVLSALLKRLADGDTVQVAEFAAQQGFARATTFMIARRLREHGLIVADAERGLAPGPVLRQFAWAGLGLPELAGPAEAVMRWLLDQIDGRVSLCINGVAVVEMGENRQDTNAERGIDLEQVLQGTPAATVVVLSLWLPPAQKERTAFAQRCLARAALTLEGFINRA